MKLCLATIGFLLVGIAVCHGETFTQEQLDFFETKIRPLLAAHCYECHADQAKTVQGGLRLDSREALLEGGDSGPAATAGEVEASLILQAVRYEAYEMPPDGKLKPEEILALERWVRMGMPWPRGTAVGNKARAGYDWDVVQTSHWAWLPLHQPVAPASRPGDRVRNEIDQFVIRGLRANGLSQAQPAEAALFIRRVFWDLTGLPPTPRQMNDWVRRLEQQPREGNELNHRAVAELIDVLLASPAYGERWGRHWLDVARYSDGFGGFLDNRGLPNAFRYRDWVVQALNDDMPYDDFVRCQIAGDVLASERGDPSLALGTGFFAVGPTYHSDGGDPESVAQAKGETLDDRVDTLSRAFLGLTVSCARCHDHKFDPIPTQDYYSLAGIFNNSDSYEMPLADEHEVLAFQAHQKEIQQAQDKLKKLRQRAKAEKRELTAVEQKQLTTWQQQVDELKKTAPAKYDTAHAIQDKSSEDMHVALRGDLRKQGPLAPRRFLRLLAGEERPRYQQGSGRRELAEDIVADDNPLTSRVIVNRVWQQHFGSGLVRSPSNFGSLGQPPSHPELLDWLAGRLIEFDWSLKSLHRLIMNSATYRNSSRFRESAFARDGDNRYMWRMSPRRMDVETWRDALLAVTGELEHTKGGRPVDDITASNRRTLYAKVSRNGDVFQSDRFLQLFDFPVPRATNARRVTSVIPQQFLFMLNSEFMVRRAKALAERLRHEAADDETRIQFAYQLLYGRAVSDAELRLGMEFVQSASPTQAELNGWQRYCQVLLSSNEFMYIR